MPAIYWGSTRIIEKDFNRKVEVGDVLQLEVDGEIDDYVVDKVYFYYPRQGKPEERISVSNETALPVFL